MASRSSVSVVATLRPQSWRHNLRQMLQSLAVGGGGEFQADGIDEQAWDWLARRMTFLTGDFTQPEIYDRLKALLAEQSARQGSDRNVLFYLAVADKFFGPIIDRLGRADLTGQTNGAWRRVIIEKPFGHDLASARALNAQIRRILSEDQIYRIDHFLGKETVQNILVLRFANGIFEPLWNRDHISHVQITAAETVGVETRGRFYDGTGALRDMVPNHLFQLLAMIAMEPPVSFSANDVRAKKTDLFCAIHPIAPDDAVRGQYGAGTVLGKPVRDYRHEPNVAPGLHDRDVRCAQARHRQLALGRRAVLSPHRQVPVGAHHRDRDPVSPGALRPVPGDAGRAAAAQHPDACASSPTRDCP